MDNAFPPPVERLIHLGEQRDRVWQPYSALGITAEHVPDLMRVLRSPEYDVLPGDRPEVWAPVHAWRALAQLRAPELVPHLLERLDEFTDDDWDDFLLGDFAPAMALVGPPALDALTAHLKDPAKKGPNSMNVADAIAAIGRDHPDVRPRVVDILLGEMRNWRQNPPDLNAMLVSSLADFRVQEAMPVIREAIQAGAVDQSFCGTAEYIEWEMGPRTGPQPPLWSHHGGPLGSPGLGSVIRGRRNARERAQARRKQAKAARKRNRKKR